jgi:hypothetical protein
MVTQNLLEYLVADSFRIIQRELLENTPMTKDGYEFRYEQTGDTYRLQGFFNPPDVHRSAHGNLATRPEWLVKIVDVAVVANTVSRATAPPPDLILWFSTDKQFNLTEYINV